MKVPQKAEAAMTRMTGLIILALSGVFSLPAFACDPASNYGVSITSSDAPSCLIIDSYGDYSAFSILVNNTCDQPVAVEPRDCVECDGPIELQAGEERRVMVEATESSGTREVSWLSGDDSGIITVDLTYRDNSNACDGWDDGPFGCQQAGSGGNTLIGFLFILGWIGTRRLLASEV